MASSPLRTNGVAGKWLFRHFFPQPCSSLVFLSWQTAPSITASLSITPHIQYMKNLSWISQWSQVSLLHLPSLHPILAPIISLLITPRASWSLSQPKICSPSSSQSNPLKYKTLSLLPCLKLFNGFPSHLELNLNASLPSGLTWASPCLLLQTHSL